MNIAPYYTAGQLRPTGGPHNSLRTRLRAALVYSYIGRGRGVWFNYKAVIYKQQVTLKVRLNEKVVGRTELHKTQRIIGLLFSCSAGIFSATGRVILRRVYFRKREIIFEWRKTLLKCSTYLSLRYIYASFLFAVILGQLFETTGIISCFIDVLLRTSYPFLRDTVVPVHGVCNICYCSVEIIWQYGL